MDENSVQQINESTARLAAAAEALQQTLAAISARQEELSAKIEKIVAAIEENPPALSAKAAERTGHPRKTLSPLVTMILAKSGAEETSDTAQLDKALSALSPEQRIAVKGEMARAGIIQ
jgi:formate dehydrogenase maturation protein FdhE